MKKIITLMLILSMFIVACEDMGLQPITPPTGPGTQVQPGIGTYDEVSFDISEKVETKTFTSADELLNFIKENQGTSNAYYGRGEMMVKGMAMDMAVAESAEGVTTAVPAAAPMEDRDFSETNVQVKGVDEADIIKTDGNYIYTVSENTLFIIKAYPGEEAEIVSTIKFESRPESLFIAGDKLAVFGNFYSNEYFKRVNWQPRSGMTYLNVYEVSDKANPKLEKEYKFEGNYFNGRMIGENAYILTSTYPEARPIPMPVIFEGDVKTNVVAENVHYYNVPYNNPVFVTIHALNLEELELESKTIAVESSQSLYMSKNNIYVTYTEYIDEWQLQKKVMMDILEPKLSESDKALIEKIKKTDNDVLSRWEKEQKIYNVYQDLVNMMPPKEQEELQDEAEARLKELLEQYEYFEFTVINKVEVDGLSIKPTANGKVPGSILNQFSMDEYDDTFRIATTVNARWSRFDKGNSESENNIYTLDKDLKVLDELNGMAKGERIFSTRFMGERLYMVTFRQVDPFFVIDLSDPKDIKELGELKIPGFSRYLHPYDEDTIIGIGREATETGRQQGLKISLFDVSDVRDPKEIAKFVGEDRYAQSTAEFEHKAFLFSKEKNLLVIPVYNYDYQDSSNSYNGAFVFDISKEKVELRGLIDHSLGQTQRWWQPSVERSLYIEELLYTKSPNLLRINKIEDLSKVKNLELKQTSKIPVY